jgi:AraC-like DNA-binding protein
MDEMDALPDAAEAPRTGILCVAFPLVSRCMLSPAPTRPPAPDDIDALSRLVRLLRFRTRVFFSGRFCGDADYRHPDVPAQFHFVLEGRMAVSDERSGMTREVDAPGLIAFPCGNPHRIVATEPGGCRLLCCYVLPIDAVSSGLIRALPNPLVVDLRRNPVLAALAQLLAAEAAHERPGRDEGLQLHLKGVVLEAVRLALVEGQVPVGVLPVLADARLARAVAAFLERPGAHWTVAGLARAAGMSRSAFAVSFVRVAGTTPQQFLSAVRFDLGARLLAEGVPAKAVARAVGYASSSSFARSMRQSRSRPPRASPPSDP